MSIYGCSDMMIWVTNLYTQVIMYKYCALCDYRGSTNLYSLSKMPPKQHQNDIFCHLTFFAI